MARRIKRPPRPSKLTLFGSVTEFVNHVTKARMTTAYPGWFEGSGVKWAGGTKDDAIRYALHGDVSAVPEAEKIVSRLDDQIDSEGIRQTWEPSVVGYVPLVPAYLAGACESMLAPSDAPDSRGDLEIWVDTSVSANVKTKDMRRRGVVVLALALALSRVRNVRIVVYCSNEGPTPAIRLSSPLDISEVCAAVCQPSFTRQLMFRYSMLTPTYDGCIAWATWAAGRGDVEAERRALMEGGMPEDAIHLPCQKMGEFASLSDEDLIDFLNGKLREYASRAS
ncbi:MAG: hypothetical protein IJG13_20215 [Kiritimatiellae bacterium]|nr:hypothetical protein [Kiritimatiellia bacterium]